MAVLLAVPSLAQAQTRLAPTRPILPAAAQPGDSDAQILAAISALSAQVAALQQQVNQQGDALKALQITANLTLTETDKTKAIAATTDTTTTAIQGSLGNLTSNQQAIQTSLNSLAPTVNALQLKVASTYTLAGMTNDRTLDMGRRLYMTCILLDRVAQQTDPVAKYDDSACTSAGWYASQNGHYGKGTYNFDTAFLVQGGVAPAAAGAPETLPPGH